MFEDIVENADYMEAADPGALPGASGICGAFRALVQRLDYLRTSRWDGWWIRMCLQIGKAVSARAFFGYAKNPRWIKKSRTYLTF